MTDVNSMRLYNHHYIITDLHDKLDCIPTAQRISHNHNHNAEKHSFTRWCYGMETLSALLTLGQIIEQTAEL